MERKNVTILPSSFITNLCFCKYAHYFRFYLRF